ncbi:hypothetical protein niasHS_004932 [Heterodera schachtii]|uniref:Uncharacterized protein n=1 Tax=Heterodera schachtii TaxID=97005 RepID=A0ABD2K0X4_HETSC
MCSGKNLFWQWNANSARLMAFTIVDNCALSIRNKGAGVKDIKWLIATYNIKDTEEGDTSDVVDCTAKTFLGCQTFSCLDGCPTFNF